jgi:hypothetical protein
MRISALRWLCVLLAGPLVVDGAAAQRQDFRVTVTNGAIDAVEYFYFSECGINNWGKDRLGSKEVISPGARRRFDMYEGNADCCRDMRAILSTGASRQRLGVDVCRKKEWVVR